MGIEFNSVHDGIIDYDFSGYTSPGVDVDGAVREGITTVYTYNKDWGESAVIHNYPLNYVYKLDVSANTSETPAVTIFENGFILSNAPQCEHGYTNEINASVITPFGDSFLNGLLASDTISADISGSFLSSQFIFDENYQTVGPTTNLLYNLTLVVGSKMYRYDSRYYHNATSLNTYISKRIDNFRFVGFVNGSTVTPTPYFSDLKVKINEGITATRSVEFPDCSYISVVATQGLGNYWSGIHWVFNRWVTINFNYIDSRIVSVNFEYEYKNALDNFNSSYAVIHTFDDAIELSNISFDPSITGKASSMDWILGGQESTFTTLNGLLSNAAYENENYNGTNVTPMFIERIKGFDNSTIPFNESIPDFLMMMIHSSVSIKGYDIEMTIKDGFIEGITKVNEVDWVCALEQ